MAADARAMGIAGARLSRVQGLLRLKGTEPADPQDPGSEARHTREFQRAVAQLLQDGPSIQDVARAVDVPAAVVRQWRDASGQRTGRGTRRNRPNYSPEVKEQALRDVEAGKPIPEVARDTGIPYKNIYGWVKKAEKSGRQFRDRQVLRYSPEVKERAVGQVRAGRSIKEVAGELGIHATTLSGWVSAAEG